MGTRGGGAGDVQEEGGRKLILQMFGSAVSSYYWKVSTTYGQNCASSTQAAAKAAGFDFAYVQVHPNNRWSFPRDVPNMTHDELEALGAPESGSVDAAEGARILAEMNCDAAMNHMFCFPGMTTYRSLLDFLNVPYVGCSAESMVGWFE